MPVPENAQAGWEIYRASDYELTLAEVNDELAARERPAVSQRMCTHYRKLHRYGYEQYIPINQLDVRTMEGTGLGSGTARPIPAVSVEEPVRVLLLRDDEVVELAGVAEELSDGEVIVRVPGDAAISAFEQKGIWTLELVFTVPGEMSLREVSKVTLDRRRQRITVRGTFIAMESADEVLLREPISMRTFNVVVG